MTLRPGEVVLIRIDFHQASGGKLRPAAVLLDSGDEDFVGAPVTSRSWVSDFDVPIQQWREGGPHIGSPLRVYKLSVPSKDESVLRFGQLTAGDRIALAEVLRRAFSIDR